MHGLSCRVCVGKHLSDAFPIHGGLKEGYILSPLFFNFAPECAIKEIQEKHKEQIEWL